MRKIPSSLITAVVAENLLDVNRRLPSDVLRAIKKSLRLETFSRAKDILAQIVDNASVAAKTGTALCQDTGMAEIFIKLGREVQITGGGLEKAVNAGVAKAYVAGYLRKSVLNDPFQRRNTRDNTPARIYLEPVEGDKLEITVLAKGGGSENASALKMMPPAAGWQDVRDFVVEIIRKSGPNSCPPLIIGVGVGGSFSSVALLAKKALLRKVGSKNALPSYRAREAELLKIINLSGIGPMGLGGRATALAVHINAAPCHIASLPVAVSMQCHSARSARAVI